MPTVHTEWSGTAAMAILTFGRCEIDLIARQVRVDGHVALLGPRAFDVLEVLIEARGQLVTKAEILDRAWGGLMVEENNLQVQVAALRKQLGARAIVTIPGRGYRFALAAGAAPEPATTDGPGRHNLPEQVTSLIGREQDITAIEGALRRARLVTLTGVGGIGKTRLALAVATRANGAFADGLCFVDLAALDRALPVAPLVARALDVPSSGQDLRSTLLAHLEHRKLLLVLDNCEHVIESCAQLCHDVLVRCDGLRILATSRESLRVQGEQTYIVPPLPIPRADVDASATSIRQYASVALFVERATAARASFAMSDANIAAIVAICRRLDGIPLAIELAARRIGVLSAQEVARGLDDRFRLLDQGPRAEVTRQQTLGALIDWSHELLSPDEQDLFRRLAVFAGGWSLDAARVVCRATATSDGTIPDLLEQLVNKSLVVVEERAGEMRYRLLDTLRAYALARLRTSDDADAAQQAHLDYFLTLVEATDMHLLTADQGPWLDHLDCERENLLAALAWTSSSRGRAADGLRLAGALGTYWWLRGLLREGRRWLALLLDLATDAPPASRRKALCAMASLALGQGEPAAAQSHHEAALASAASLAERHETARSQLAVAYWAWSQGTPDARVAQAMFDETLRMCRAVGDAWGAAMAMNGLGFLALIPEHDVARARNLHQQALVTFASIADRVGASYAISGLGFGALLEDDLDEAGRRYREALGIARDLDDRRGIAEALDGLADVVAGRGEPAAAARIWGASQRLREEFTYELADPLREHHARRIAAARAALGRPEAFDVAWDADRARPLDEVIDAAWSTLDEAIPTAGTPAP